MAAGGSLPRAVEAAGSALERRPLFLLFKTGTIGGSVNGVPFKEEVLKGSWDLVSRLYLGL